MGRPPFVPPFIRRPGLLQSGATDQPEAAEPVPLSGPRGMPLPLFQAALRDEMLRRIELLEATLANLPVRHPTIGHNRPPEPIEVSLNDRDRLAVNRAVADLKEPGAAYAVAQKAALTLTRIAKKIWRQLARASGCVGKQAGEFVSAAVKSGGTEFGKRAVQAPFWYELARNLHGVSQAAIDWIATLPH